MHDTHHLSFGNLGSWLDDRTPVSLGPDHPGSTGLLLADVRTESDIITDARIQPGLNHRAAEKLFEVRDYRQLLVLADRHDWHAPFIGELGVALVCEQLMGLVPPQRATWLRTLLVEHARITSHLAHLGFVAHRTGDAGLASRIRQARQASHELLLATSGNRVHPMLVRLGGLAGDIDAAWVAQFVAWSAECAALAEEILATLHTTGLGRGIAVIDESIVDGYGLSGPVARACGLDRDLRPATGALAYPQVLSGPEFLARTAPEVPTDGDAHSRFSALAADIVHSSHLVAACARQLENISGPVETKLSKMVKLPDSEAYLAIEAPWGMAGFHLVSRAERTPWRLKLRTPSFANVQALERVLVGCRLDETDIAAASLGWTPGDLDK